MDNMYIRTQDMPTIWWANAVATGASYGYAYTIGNRGSEGGEAEDDDETLPGPLKSALKVKV